MRSNADLGLKDEIFVDANTFIAVVDSLPNDQEVKFSASEGALAWKCGAARGKLALVDINEMQKPRAPKDGDEFKIKESFIRALGLGALSCDSNSLHSVGMYGVVIDNRKRVGILSSDNTTVSHARFDSRGFAGPEQFTIVPDAVELLTEVLQVDGQMTLSKDYAYYQDEFHQCQVGRVADLKYDLQEVRAKFAKPEIVVPLPRERVIAFTKRASALASNRRETYIFLGAEKGKLTMAFAEGAAQSDEYYLVDELEVPEMEPVKLDASKFAKALEHSSEVALDFITENVVVLRGAAFEYIISGRARTA